jgi:hypothetical protein
MVFQLYCHFTILANLNLQLSLVKLSHIIPALVLIIICGCHYDQRKRHHKKHKQKSITNKDTLCVTARSAISVWLDTAILEKRRKQYGDDDFYTISDDEVYYSSKADSVLRSHQLTVINTDGYKYLKFVQHNEVSEIIKIDTLSLIHTIFFFDPSKAPHNADITDIEDEYNKFYH